MIPVDAVLGAWRDTKWERCKEPTADMGRDLLMQMHLELADGTQTMVLVEEREAIPVVPLLCDFGQPIVGAVFMADSYMREQPKDAPQPERGSVAAAFHNAEPNVTEALVLHTMGTGTDETIIQRYRIGDDGLPEWGEVERCPADTSDGAIPDLMRQMLTLSRLLPGGN